MVRGAARCLASDLSSGCLSWMTHHSDVLLGYQIPRASVLKVLHRLVHLKNHQHVFLQISGWFRKQKDAFDIEVSKTFRVLLSDLPVYQKKNSVKNQKRFFAKTLLSVLFRKFNFLWDLIFKWLHIWKISLNCQFF